VVAFIAKVNRVWETRTFYYEERDKSMPPDICFVRVLDRGDLEEGEWPLALGWKWQISDSKTQISQIVNFEVRMFEI